jgi:large subunit ribosomal protein L29
MKHASVKDLPTVELKEKLKEEKGTYAKLKLSHAISSLENPMKIKVMRRSIARMKTELTKRELQDNTKK